MTVRLGEQQGRTSRRSKPLSKNVCLRTIFRVRMLDKVPNEDLWQRADQEPMGKQMVRQKWSWIGHTMRKDNPSITRQALTWNPQGKRKRGRPRNSWRRDTETEMRKFGMTWTDISRKA